MMHMKLWVLGCILVAQCPTVSCACYPCQNTSVRQKIHSFSVQWISNPFSCHGSSHQRHNILQSSSQFKHDHNQWNCEHRKQQMKNDAPRFSSQSGLLAKNIGLARNMALIDRSSSNIQIQQSLRYVKTWCYGCQLKWQTCTAVNR